MKNIQNIFIKQESIKDECYYINDIINLLKSEYVIFLTNKYLSCLKKKLLEFYRNYNILYFLYKNKNELIKNINFYNNNIKDLKNKINYKTKHIYFLENVIEPNVLYKKISFSNEELFLPFKNYTLKKMEYKLRTFCQIAEKLGAEDITIKYNNNNNKITNIKGNINLYNTDISAEYKSNVLLDGIIHLSFNYKNNHHNLNLNKYFILEMINEEKEFFITKNDFDADIDLKFLIDARCINLINIYTTTLIFNQINSLEKKIFLKSQLYGLNLDIDLFENNTNSIDINIKFLNIYETPESIDGFNIYNMKEGFWHLSNLIKDQINDIEKSKISKEQLLDKIILNNNSFIINTENEIKKKELFRKINNFLISQLKTFQNNENLINLDYNKNQNLYESYIKIIKNNFDKEEIDDLFYDYFKNNLYYEHYEIFRNLIIKETNIFFNDLIKLNILYNNYIDNNSFLKLNYISFQYHSILNEKENIISKINKYLEENNRTDKYNNFIKNIFNLSFYKKNGLFELSTKEDLLKCINQISNENINLFYNQKESNEVNIILIDIIYNVKFLDINIKNKIFNFIKTIILKLLNYDIKFENLILKDLDNINIYSNYQLYNLFISWNDLINLLNNYNKSII